ncbi:hypothetical protein D0C16_05550 [Cellvibrio sp. KY-GH-1]|nr:hypothetical protein D0C16_05550 [Cellvibrio sp. KY-GH-1]
MNFRDLFGFPKKQSANRFDPWASDAAARRAAGCVDGYAHVHSMPCVESCRVHGITLAQLYSARNGYMSQRNTRALVGFI